MASKQDQPSSVVDGSDDHEREDAKTLSERLNTIPMYAMTLSQLQSIYFGLKEKNEFLKKTFDAGEYYVQSISEAAKPVVWAATTSALKVAKPIVGEVENPAKAVDSAASEALAKVQERFPIINQTPSEIAASAKSAVQSSAAHAVETVKESALAKDISQKVTKQLDNAVSFSELMVEICFPTDGSNPEDLKELELAEEDEDKGVVVRARHLKDRTVRRGTRELMTYKPVQVTVDAVKLAHEKIAELNEKIRQGSNFVVERTNELKKTVAETSEFAEKEVGERISEGSELLNRTVTGVWDNVYKTTMYIPKKLMKVSGEVFVSGKEIIFAYTQAHSLTEMPHAIVEMAEKKYAELKRDVPTVGAVEEKAMAFVFVPAQVVSEYIRSSRPVQWIVPTEVQASNIQVVEGVSDSDQPDSGSMSAGQ